MGAGVVGGCVGAGVGGSVGTGVIGADGESVAVDSGSTDGESVGADVSFGDVSIVFGDASDGVVVSIAVAIDVWSAGVVVIADSSEFRSVPSLPEPQATTSESVVKVTRTTQREEARLMRTG